MKNISSNSSEFEMPEYTAITSLILCILIVGIGILGNLLVILVILTSKVMRSSTNLFLLNLSIADLLVLVTCTPTVLVEIIIRRDAWILGKWMCYLVPYVELSVSHTSILTILAITCERYYAICLPLQAGLICTKSKACLLCVMAWICAFVLTSPVLGTMEYIDDTSNPACLTNVDSIWAKVYFLIILIVFFIVPFVILILVYRHIARHLVPSVKNQQVIPESAALLKSRRQVVLMIATVIFFFFGCLLPFKVLTFWIIASPNEILDVINVETYYNLLYFSRLTFYINSAINPILYNIMSSKFRDEFKHICKCCILIGFHKILCQRESYHTPTENCISQSWTQTKTTDECSDSEGKNKKNSQNIVIIEERKITFIPSSHYTLSKLSSKKFYTKQEFTETSL